MTRSFRFRLTALYLGLFSFQKFVMYKDLDANSGAIRRHRLAQQLVTRAGAQNLGLPSDVQALDLDRDFPPESTAQVVDADSSQLRAIAASARGYDMVIEGPPGTGTHIRALASGCGNGWPSARCTPALVHAA